MTCSKPAKWLLIFLDDIKDEIKALLYKSIRKIIIAHEYKKIIIKKKKFFLSKHIIMTNLTKYELKQIALKTIGICQEMSY